ncbi:peptidoglycan-binding protein [Xaviernesmea oryzae]|uniref:Peptidoglycan-binding protein n=1 Tax=Xaviernesmea oryzae TaxID=464029 RepID=A0A1Q9B0C3_9HYPH|nr:murein L,D-transpeptidase [Xaviernesmea oryzae]OLP61428.1 peptidoglycan-binding protein [Xaviernesmea oryzae]SEL69569.1 Murein L,D-transpeptidase YcbB/YkuD [Xaviernesmea oryzae]
MTLKKTATLVALAAGCGLSALGAPQAHAMTLMDLFRKRSEPAQQEVTVPGVYAPGQGGLSAPPAEKRVAEPLPKVTAPRYYTYKADAPRRIDAARLLDPVVTGSIGQGVDLADPASQGATLRAVLPQVSVSATGDIAKAVEAFYAESGHFLWIDDHGVTEKGRAARDMLAKADEVGLDARDYAVALPEDSADPAAREKALATFELKLTVAALTFVQDTIRGRIDPNRISGYHDFKRKDVNLAGKLKVMAASGDIAAYLESQNPEGPQFQALRAELKRLTTENGGGAEPIRIAPGTLIKPGESNAELPNVIAAMKQRGSEPFKARHGDLFARYSGSPDYTPDLVDLVEDFQAEHGLARDGIIGRGSIRFLTGGDGGSARIDKLQIAMEEARWLPDDLGSRYVFVNQPAFQVYYHDNGQEQFSMRVVVGAKAHQTFFFEDEIQTVEFNPYWGVPQSIIINEMLPKLRSDPNYLDRLGYQVEVGGRAVASSSVDWYGSTNNVSVRQPPSSDNALGELKILFPNAHAIYMHDTPSKSFFKRDQRALSHGCIRLADPRKMAAAVLNTSVDDVAKQIAAGKNKGVSVPSRIPIYVAYFTAWPNKDGQIEYFDDVYDRDLYMNKAFEATRQVRQSRG